MMLGIKPTALFSKFLDETTQSLGMEFSNKMGKVGK